MGLISWLVDKFGGDAVPISYNDDFLSEYESLIGDIYIREMAFWSAVNLVANAVSKCEFITYLNGEETKEKEYYLWNIEPNRNQNSSVFLHKLISKLYRNNECLVIEQNGQLLVADNFNRKPYALFDDVFTQVQVEDFTFNRSFTQPEVMYFKLSEGETKKIVDGLYNSYSKLIAYSMKAYRRSRGVKGIFKYETAPKAGDDKVLFDELINKKIKQWVESDNGALPLGRGQEWKELEKKTYTSESTRDIRALIDDISDFTARAFGIPPALLRGDVLDTSKAIDQLLTFCVDPLVDMIQEEINRKRNGYVGFSQGTRLKIDTKTMKHVDLLSVSTAIDKLISSGVFCVNDILKMVGEPAIEEAWAYEHFITRNYMPFEEALKALKGGENGEE